MAAVGTYEKNVENAFSHAFSRNFQFYRRDHMPNRFLGILKLVKVDVDMLYFSGGGAMFLA